jgi:hypothetical protein
MALGFPERCHGSGRAFDVGFVLVGAYPKERAAWVEPALRSVVESNRGDMLSREEAQRVWEQRFFPASSLGPIPRPGIRSNRTLSPNATELERKLVRVAIQGSVARWGEVSLLAFDASEGSSGVVDLSSVTDAALVQMAGRSWMPRRQQQRSSANLMAPRVSRLLLSHTIWWRTWRCASTRWRFLGRLS